MRPSVPALLLAATALLSTTTASAGGPPGSVEPTAAPQYDYGFSAARPTKTERYGGQILLADAAWLAATMVVGNLEANSSSDGDASITGVLAFGYFVTGPAVHMKHGNNSGAAKSLAARALLPVAGMMVGAVAFSQDCPNDSGLDCGFNTLAGMMVGGLAGGVGAMVLDWTVLGKKEVRIPGAEVIARVQPRVGVTKDAVSVGFGGSF
jgi:hypothetical protein